MQMATSLKKRSSTRKTSTTEDAIKYHAFRAHLQILQWMGTQVEATQWGWKNESNVLVPIKSDEVRRYDKLLLFKMIKT